MRVSLQLPPLASPNAAMSSQPAFAAHPPPRERAITQTALLAGSRPAMHPALSKASPAAARPPADHWSLHWTHFVSSPPAAPRSTDPGSLQGMHSAPSPASPAAAPRSTDPGSLQGMHSAPSPASPAAAPRSTDHGSPLGSRSS